MSTESRNEKGTDMTEASGARGAGPISGYADWPEFLRTAPEPPSDDPERRALTHVLGVRQARARDLTVIREWRADGVHGRELQWTLEFGPSTRAYLLTPEKHSGSLPGLVGMHCHGGVRSTGAEQLLTTDRPASESAQRLRTNVYDGKAPANDLARDGFAVLCHDTFSWHSRAFDFSTPTPKLAGLVAAQEALWRGQGVQPTPAQRFDTISSLHEDSIAKAAGMLGTTLAGAVATDDLAALEVLANLTEVDPTRIGTFGLSGGGGRAILLGALDPRVSAVATTCMMATFDSLVPAELDTHSWLLNSPGLWAVSDWPDVTAIGQQRSTLVQYGLRDPLFSEHGMRGADHRLRTIHPEGAYRGTFYDASHESTSAMQTEVRAFFAETLQPVRDH